MQEINVLQFITPAGLYGAEMWILALSRNLNKNKINCFLAVSEESNKQNLELYERYRQLGLHAYKIKMRGKFDPFCIIKLIKLIKHKKISIIHTHGYKSDIIGIIIAKLTGIKSISTPHGFENIQDKKFQLYIKLGCMTFKYFDIVAPLSKDLMDDVLNFNVKLKNIKLIMNGVDLTEVEIERNRKEIEKKDFNIKTIGYVGQLAFRKNLRDMIEVFNLLFLDHKNIRLLLIGDGPKRNELEKFAHSLPSSSNIYFLGYRSDRLKLVKDLDLFCMTSSLEGIPRCMMEAMALQVPVAAYNIPGVDKLIIHRETGLMADFGDIKGLKSCWEKILFDNQFSKKISLNGRNHILENFSAKRMADEYTKIYQFLVH